MKAFLIPCLIVVMLSVASSQQIDYSQWKAPPSVSRAFKRAEAHTYEPGLHQAQQTSTASTHVSTEAAKAESSMQQTLPRVASMPDVPTFSQLADQMKFNTMPSFPKIQLPSIQWPFSSPKPSSTTTASPSPEQQSPSVPSPSPDSPPAGTTTSTPDDQPNADVSACSKTDTSPEAVLRCVNAVRSNPHAFVQDFGCDWQSWINEVASPARPAFKANSQLTSAAKRQAEGMARTSTVSHTGDDGSSVAQRIKDSGFTGFPQAENVAGGQRSAYEVTMQWMCSDGHRRSITNCELDSVGTWTSYDSNSRAYFVQDFGCESGNCRC